MTGVGILPVDPDWRTHDAGGDRAEWDRLQAAFETARMERG